MSKTLRKLFCVFIVCLLTCLISIHPAISDESANKEIPLNQYGIRSTNPFVVDRFIENGKSIDKIIVPGPPHPPAGFVRPQVANLPVPNIAAGTNTLTNVPALTWVFGCSATSAAMMFGYYDNSGYPNMYAGPTNGGVFPMTNAAWGTVVINGETGALCPLSATRNGLDGRVIRGHVDDYWIKYDNAGPDPFIADSWTEHTQGECTGDYMGTNQSRFGNTDGSTTFWNYEDGSPLYDYTGDEPSGRDGGHGLKLFVESRGYTVQANGNFNQYIQGRGTNPALGFTFANFKAEIDAGRPVLIQVTGHTMLGYGYNDTGSTIYIRDTWDYLDHSMTWGGIYGGMPHYGVTVLRLATPPAPTDTQLSRGVALSETMTAPVQQGTWRYYYIDIPGGLTNLVIDLYNLTADLDLYVQQGSKPTLSSYTCGPYIDGTTSESCTFSSPTSGRWWIGVNNWSTGTISYTVKARWSKSKGLPWLLLLLQ